MEIFFNNLKKKKKKKPFSRGILVILDMFGVETRKRPKAIVWSGKLFYVLFIYLLFFLLKKNILLPT